MTSLDRVDLSFKWCIPVGTVLILFLVWHRSKKKRGKTIKSISVIPLFYKIFVEFLLRPVEQKKTFRIADYAIPVIFGLTQMYRNEKLIQGVWGGQRFILCLDPKISEKIFLSSFALNKDRVYKIMEPWLGMGIFTCGADRWRMKRKMLTPAFHFRILNDFLKVFNEQSKIIVENLKKFNAEIIDISSIVSLCTLDIIAETAMGVRLNAQNGGFVEYVEAVEFLTSSVFELIITPRYWIKPLYWFTSHAKQQRKSILVVHNFSRNVIRKRKEEILKDKETQEVFQDLNGIRMKKRAALLDLLLYHHLTDDSLSEEELREEVDTFTFAGQDTTALTISWMLYLLGWHKDIQEKAYQELWNIYGDDKEREVTTEELKEMKYLERIIKETLRLYPGAPIIVRRTSNDIEADEYVIPANSSVAVPIYAFHHDPANFPNPEIFDPDRFLQQNSYGRHPFAYIPFSAGSRNCIGQRYAIMEIKTIVSYIIRNFTVTSIDHRDKINFAGDMLLRPKEPIHLIFQKR